jgi:ABC-2 type transport system permease protein
MNTTPNASPAGFGGNLPAQGSTAPGDARIFDRGYRRYEGERRGVRGAFFTLYLATLQRILGLRRGAKAKILPVLTIGIAYLPAIVVIGVSVMFPKRLDRILPDYHEYYGTIITAILLFVAFVAPEALCPDRRYKILGVYLSSPLSRLSYVVAKFAAVFTVLCAVTLGPVVLLVIAKSFLDVGPALVDLPILLLRVLGAGIALSAFFSAVSLAIASMTDRKGFASAGFVLLTIVSQVVGAVIGGGGGGADRRFEPQKSGVLVSVVRTPSILAEQIYGKTVERITFGVVPTLLVFFAMLIVALGVLVIRYRKLEVTR